MTLVRLLRAIAMTMAVLAAIDPAVTRSRRVPAAVELHVGPLALASDRSRSAATEVRRRLQQSLGAEVAFNSDAPPAARVSIGGDLPAAIERDNVPVSTVRLAALSGPDARIVSVNAPSLVPLGWTVGISASIEGRRLAGTTATVVLEQQGTEIATVERKWPQDPSRLDVALPYAPTREGVSRLTIRVRPASGEADDSDNAVDVAVVGSERRLKVLTHEPRPSWAAAFARRALEENPTFDVSTLVNSSRGIAVRAGSPPAGLVSDSLNAYDVVIVGAPEELAASDVSALDRFARVRGGTVVFLPDRRPSGRYLEMLGNTGFDEALVDGPLEVQTSGATKLHASELALSRQGTTDTDILASVELQHTRRPLIFSRPLGSGMVVFSGALDAWRFRGRSDGGFARFWQTLAADAALRAPSRLAIEIDPAIARPGEAVRIRARLRRTEIQELADRTVVPQISARVIGPRGAAEHVRLWPSAEEGVFEGRLRPPAPGIHDVQVNALGSTVDGVLMSASDARPLSLLKKSEAGSALVAAATGGVAVASDDLAPLEQHLRSLPRSSTPDVHHPARSLWFSILFGTLVCAEWTLRRKRGLP